MKDILRMGFILFMITASAGLLLGGAYELTKNPIEHQNQKIREQALKEILPQAHTFRDIEESIDDFPIESVTAGFREDDLIGYVIKVRPKGYGGPIDLMVGISNEGVLQGIKILKHGETPGLGANAENPTFSQRFVGKILQTPLAVVKGISEKNHEIEAITGATITSKAIAQGVNTAMEFYHSILQERGEISP